MKLCVVLHAQMADKLGSMGSGLVRAAAAQGGASAKLLAQGAGSNAAALVQGYVITSKCSASLKVELQVRGVEERAKCHGLIVMCSGSMLPTMQCPAK